MATPSTFGFSPGSRVANDPYKCGNCDRTSTANGSALLRCSRCKLTWYCNRKCQRKDWKNHKLRCDLVMSMNRIADSLPPDVGVELGPTMTLGDLMKYSPENIDKEVIKRDPAGVSLTKDQDAICNILIERTWLADNDASKHEAIGPMLYRESYRKVKKIWRDHSSTFNDSFEKSIALVGGFEAIEKINVAGGNRFCGKTMVVHISVEKNAGVANALRTGGMSI
ncbi:hypothetical protein P171DRAFT_526628 [Karstenula rhodostoma CBS 690.94]|uniref:MYND-type domain-containing protein n=1 Tax=Karstenula rhodostoma CBS 690.94 TaxID=1392251 RepID=A0A9P4P5Q9_9PLEO|nr:hypothetical protein P171DRAFT_526628 [Karstenula rhodostoma CBS 690.94]